MKKIIILLVLAVIVTTGVFADHPGGLGIGVLWRGNVGSGSVGHGGALSLKLPVMPIFWGIYFKGESGFNLGLTGDKYIINIPFVPGINLHAFVGLGGFLGFQGGDEAALDFGARLPIGLSLHFLQILELFADVAPSVGLGMHTSGEGDISLITAFPVEIGIRIWF